MATANRTDVVITTCTLRKTARPPIGSTPASLPVGAQNLVQAAWIEKVQTLPASVAAGLLYAGRGFGLATDAAESAEAKLYILSAGLGLVPADRQVPLYGLTVSPGYSESIAARVTGEFDAAAWFAALLSSSRSDQWAEAIGSDSGRILIALTRPYAQMVGESLSMLEPRALARLRIFGTSLASALPAKLHPAIAPYDTRLDAILPGTRVDFSQRALHHFVGLVAGRSEQERDADYRAVANAFEKVKAPDRPNRPRRTDAEILEMISLRLHSQLGIARILRALRDEEGVACEQSRFSRLYRVALKNRQAA